MPREDLDPGRILVHLDALLAENEMTLTELAGLTGITTANLSILKNGHARAVRFNTLTAICDALDCLPGDVISLLPADGSQE